MLRKKIFQPIVEGAGAENRLKAALALVWRLQVLFSPLISGLVFVGIHKGFLTSCKAHKEKIPGFKLVPLKIPQYNPSSQKGKEWEKNRPADFMVPLF